MSEQARRQHIIGLLTMPVKKIAGLDEQELVQMIQEIESVKIESVKEGRFLDADNAKNKLKELKGALDKRKKTDIKSRHSIEKLKLEEDFNAEMKAFTDHWNEKLANYQEECNAMERELLEHNKRAIDEYRGYLESSLAEKPKDSTKLIAMKAQIESLVRQEEYKDAHFMQQKAFDLEKEEQDKYNMERAKKMENLIDQKVQIHQTDYQSLRKRILMGLDELELQRKNEYDRLFLKYNNLKKNIESSQTIQSNLFEKSIKTDRLQNSIKQYYVTNGNGADAYANK